VDTQPCSWLLRNLVRLIALALLLMGLVVNFAGFFDDSKSSDYAGMSGCVGVCRACVRAWVCVCMDRQDVHVCALCCVYNPPPPPHQNQPTNTNAHILNPPKKPTN